ncbi:MAG: DNA-binding protein [Bacteroidota bacterium]|nr:DNA-binding protein [Bacteroidota bacterium]
MDKLDLTTSDINRQNILNNKYALNEIQKATGIEGLVFEKQYKMLTEEVAHFFEIDTRTIKRYLKKYDKELNDNGYEILKDERLKRFKELYGQKLKIKAQTPQLGVFNFKSFLNLSMLLVESEKARTLRSAILDIVIDTINQKTGGNVKYINQRDKDFVIQYFKGEFYKREFIDALENYVKLSLVKYPIYIDKIYYSIFKEKAQEFRQILNLSVESDERKAMYAEILLLISSFEFGLAKEIEKRSKEKQRKLEYNEVDDIFKQFINQPLLVPLIEDARTKMASRDYAFKGAFHNRLEEYITSLPTDDFERFIGEKSKTLEEWLDLTKDVFKRLKERK